MNQLTKSQQIVYNAIQKFPAAADDDALLMAVIWQDNWLDGQSLYHNLKFNMHPESIARRRRELHGMGLIHYSKESDKMRHDAFKNEVEEHHNLKLI